MKVEVGYEFTWATASLSGSDLSPFCQKYLQKIRYQAILITWHKINPLKRGSVEGEREINGQLIQTLLYPSIQMLERFNKGIAAM